MVRNYLVLTGLAIAIAVLASTGHAQESNGRGTPAKAATKASAAAPVNLNTASAIELQTLPGVGPATSARILEYRQKAGGFKKIEDLMNIQGIGEKSFLKLKPLVIVSAPKVG
jgi:competence protein ComEA